MTWEVKILEEKQKILIVGKLNQPFISILKKILEDYGAKIFIIPNLPQSFKKFDYYFLINPHPSVKNYDLPKKNIFFIFFNQKPFSIKEKKIIEIKGDKIHKNIIEQILWFCFSNTKENHLLINLPKIIKKQKNYESTSFVFSPFNFLNKKIFFVILIIFVFVFHFIFIPPLIASGYFFHQTVQLLKKEDIRNAKNNFSSAKNYFFLSKNLYSLSRPVYLLFSIAAVPDDLIILGEKLSLVLENGFLAYDNSKNIFSSIFEKNKSEDQKKLIFLRIKNLSSQLKMINDNLSILTQKLSQFDFLKKENINLNYFNEYLTKLIKFYPDFEKIISATTEKKFLIFFTNNMELRPGGGFIGSLGVLKIKDYTIEEIQIYDVYDIDGQLIFHVDPPEPIKKYLNLPHWFLRDSNFSPDAWENYQKAKFFLENSVGWKDFSGGVFLTTTAVQKILSAFPPIYLPDFKEKITKDNFYLKTQFYVEKDFFPGSIQKKSFLNSLLRNIIINISEVSIKDFATILLQLLDEKQMVLVSDQKETQKIIEDLGWGGRVAQPRCLSSLNKDCVVNFLFPYEANLGSNKANFFINRHYDLKMDIDSSGKITNHLIILFKNEAKESVFTGVNYRNFYQVLIAKQSNIKEIKKDGVLIDDFQVEENDKLKNISFFLEIEPKKTTLVEIVYQLNEKLPFDTSILQLIIQKQIGITNSDLTLTLNLAKNISVLNQNFFPLVKKQEIIYNTSLSTDKIFFIQLKKTYD